MNKPRFSHFVRCKGDKKAEEKCGHYSEGLCDLAEWFEGWEKNPCPLAEWPQKSFNRYTVLIYDNSN